MIFIKTGSKRKRHGQRLYLSSGRIRNCRRCLKNVVGEYCHNLLNTVNWNSYKLIIFHFMYSTIHIFDICLGRAPASVRKLSGTWYLTLSFVNPTTYWLSIRYIFKTTHCRSVLKVIIISLANEIVQTNTGLNIVHGKVRTEIKRPLENSPFIALNSKSAFYIPSCCTQEIVVHSFSNTEFRFP